jgi:hypothetical protein
MTSLQKSRVAPDYNDFSVSSCDRSHPIKIVGAEHATMSAENLGKPVLSEPKTIARSAAAAPAPADPLVACAQQRRIARTPLPPPRSPSMVQTSSRAASLTAPHAIALSRSRPRCHPAQPQSRSLSYRRRVHDSETT